MSARDNAQAVASTGGAGDRWIGEMVTAIMASRHWPRVAVVSPYAKRGVVAHGLYDHASILKLIEWRFGLEPLTERDRRAAAVLEAFDFDQAPRPPIALP